MKDDFADAYDSGGFLDSAPFKRYRDSVVEVIATSRKPVTIRAIHLKLGDAAKPEWTMDALEMARGIEEVGILPSRYRVKHPSPRRPRHEA